MLVTVCRSIRCISRMVLYMDANAALVSQAIGAARYYHAS